MFMSSYFTAPNLVKLLVALGLAGVALAGQPQQKPANAAPQVSSIGESLQKAGQHPLHILYVHGIGATGAGDSWGATPVRPPQIVAWSDPSDLLSWCIPAEKPLLITNLYVRNTWWHWLIANPQAVHNNYDRNRSVLKIIMGSKSIPEKGEVCY